MKRRSVLVALALWLSSAAAAAGESFPDSERGFSLGLNVAAPLAYGGLAAAYETALVAVPVEAEIRLSDRWGLAASLHYLYLTSDRLHFEVQDGDGSVRFHADDAHQVLVGVGPRFSLSGGGLDGWYVFLELAAVYSEASGKVYYPSMWEDNGLPATRKSARKLDLGFRPEVGYSFSWGRPGLYLSLGVGIRILFNVICDPPPADYHQTSDFDLFIMYTPIINVTLGFTM